MVDTQALYEGLCEQFKEVTELQDEKKARKKRDMELAVEGAFEKLRVGEIDTKRRQNLEKSREAKRVNGR